MLRAGLFEGQEIGESARLQHVADGCIRVGDQFKRGVRLDRRTRPDCENLARQPVNWPDEESGDVHGQKSTQKARLSGS